MVAGVEDNGINNRFSNLTVQTKKGSFIKSVRLLAPHAPVCPVFGDSPGQIRTLSSSECNSNQLQLSDTASKNLLEFQMSGVEYGDVIFRNSEQN